MSGDIDIGVVEHDDWHHVSTDKSWVLAEWSHFTRPLGIRCLYAADGDLNVVLLRYVEADGFHGPIETVTRRTDEDSIDETVSKLMDDIDASDTTVKAVGAEESEVWGEAFVTFYCVYSSELPDDIEPEDLGFGDEGDELDSMTADMDRDADISVHGYTTHTSEVTRDD